MTLKLLALIALDIAQAAIAKARELADPPPKRTCHDKCRCHP